MRIDCYNACECMICEVEYGDTFYYDGTICMRVNAYNVPFQTGTREAFVRLNTGEIGLTDHDTLVIMADTKIVANTKEVQ